MENERLVGTVGRCTPEKNQAFLLEAFALARKRDPRLKLLIVGDGPLRASLEEQAKKLAIDRACRFYGFTDNVAPLYSAVDLFCLPSALEGLGIVAIEAQANGCPCVLSDRVPPEADAGGDVTFLPIENPRHWCEAMLHPAEFQRRAGTGALLQKYNLAHSTGMMQEKLLGVS